MPACWQREAPTACLRVELPSGEIYLFAYQHFFTASLRRDESGTETLRICFSGHDIDIEGRGLRELLLGLQDFAVKWLRTAPERYSSLSDSRDGIVSTIHIKAAQ
jgi:hypothetical protein